MRLKYRDWRGDTIIEVMVVLAVLGLALSIAYATANRSLLDARQAQETSYASAQVQNQLEGLRVLGQTAAPTPSQNIYTTAKFCLTYNAGLNSYTVTSYGGGATPASCALPFDVQSSLAVYYCGGSHAGYGGAVCSGLTNDTFLVVASWPDLETPGTDTVTQAYRVHP